MSEERRWTARMLGAWQYAVSTVERGMTATAGYEDLFAYGMAPRTSDWYYLCGKAREAQASGDIVQGLPFETPIPGQAYTTVEIDYGQKYVAVADLRYVDVATGEVMRRTITVENDQVQSWPDIEDAIDEVAAAYGVVGGAAGVQILRTRFYSPRWIEW